LEAQHKEKQLPGFTKRYGVSRLAYFEAVGDLRNAISREKEIKGWRREKKLALIRSMNPAFRDLSLACHLQKERNELYVIPRPRFLRPRNPGWI
jgi:predicted GIY-YIG superfamily endonuclease